MKYGRISNEIKKEITNNFIFDTVFDTSLSLLKEDTELSLEILDETAPPRSD